MPEERNRTELFAGEGEMHVLIRAFDWSSTPLGPMSSWPQSLMTTVGICLSSAFPMIVLWGEELVQVYNDGYGVILGARHPAALGVPTREAWPEVWHINEPLYAGVQRGETYFFENQLYPITRNGFEEEAYFTLCYSPVHNEDGCVGGVLVTVTETTQRVFAERRLEESAQQLAQQAQEIQARNRVLEDHAHALEEVNRELEAFSYSVSHDIRTPVRHILGFLKLTRRSLGADLREETARALNVIEQAGNRMNQLLDAIVLLSNINRTPLRVGPVDLGALMTRARLEHEAELAGRAVLWKVASMPLVWGDRDALTDVIDHLVSNAVKFTRAREQTVIEVWAEEQASGWTVYVRDNGAGFNPMYRDKLFGLFQRLHREEEFEGLGVGLASVHRLIKRHGGTVSASSVPGEGATFSFTLPKER